LNRIGRIEEAVSRDDVSGGTGLFEDADGGLGNHVVCNDVVVAGEKDAGFSAVENMILTGTGLIAVHANAIENDCGEGFIAVDRSIVAVNEDVDLADASSVAGDLHIVGLSDENVSRDSGARGDACTRRPDVVSHHIFENRSRGAKTNLDAILRELGEKEITSVLVEGGGEILGQALDQRLVDKVQLYIGPILVGGPVIAFPGIGAGSTEQALRLDRVRYERIGQDI